MRSFPGTGTLARPWSCWPQGKAEEVTAVGSGCHKEIHTPGYTRWEGGNESHTLINVGKVPVVIDVMSFDPVGNNQPVIPTSKPPNCSL